jgi:two-component system, sensor histidine kinase RegB
MPRRVFSPDVRPLERVRINFGWLLKLRWAAFAGQLATIAFVQFWLGIDLPLYGLAVILLLEALSNIVLHGWFRGQLGAGGDEDESARTISRTLGAVLVLDVGLLTLLLWLTGGARNPFSEFYLVNIVLSGVVLGPRWTTLVALCAILGYAFVYHYHVPLPLIAELGAGTWAVILQQRGIATAFIAASVVIGFFLTRVTGELAALERKVSEAERRKLRMERIESLGTLAAGAAHELASPLSTIAVVAKDLEGVLQRSSSDAADDARLIRREVERCREILAQMAVDAGQMTGSELMRSTVEELLAATTENLRRAGDLKLSIALACRGLPLVVPRKALALALRQIVKNALDASPLDRHVDIDVTLEAGFLRFEVYDRGSGMAPETVARATDPFFTTKEPGQGMGLGLFLTQTVIERLDGRISFDSEPGLGTTVRVELPIERLSGALATEPRPPAAE